MAVSHKIDRKVPVTPRSDIFPHSPSNSSFIPRPATPRRSAPLSADMRTGFFALSQQTNP
jgi:hypothetical protein